MRKMAGAKGRSKVIVRGIEKEKRMRGRKKKGERFCLWRALGFILSETEAEGLR